MHSVSWRLILRVITILLWLLAILWFIVEPGYEPLIAIVTGIGILLGSFAVGDTPVSDTFKYMRSISWRLILRVITVLSWLLAILWFISEPGYEPLTAVITGIGTLLGSFAVGDIPVSDTFKYKPTPEKRKRNRRAMLELVRNTWVKGVLEQSLHGAAMIELGMEECAEAVEHPWDMVLQTPDRPNRILPPGTKMVDVFDEMNGGLLILGEPGSGKTTMLLDLARDAIARAEQNRTQFIPVVFNLSSWAEKRQPIARWLVEELNAKYNIPKKIARLWLENDELLLLLDGLDEVKLEYREACAKAINDFRQQHLVPLVVCSRIADYEALTTRLKLRGAVLLQPLTPQQIEARLAGTGSELQAVRATIQHDTTLQELARSPLTLSVMTLAYRGLSIADLRTLDTSTARRQHLFATYVEQMFKRRGLPQPYPKEQTRHWLAWLAQKMIEHDQTIFLIERLQPDWLTPRAQRRARLVAWLLGGLGVGLFSGLVGGLGVGLVSGLVLGPVGGLGVGHRVGLTGSVEPMDALKWSWQRAIRGLATGLLVGLLMGLLGEWLGRLVFGLAFGLVVGLFFWLVGGLPGGLLLRLVFGLVMGLAGGLAGGQIVGLFGGLGAGLLFGLCVGLAYALVGGLGKVEIKNKTVPNQGIRQSAKNVLIIGVPFGLLELLVAWFVGVLLLGRSESLVQVLVLGLVLGLIVGLMAFGGVPVILHLALRYTLWRSDLLPWHLVRFLDYAAERIFLRKVGGGYTFIHRLLMEHFASFAPHRHKPRRHSLPFPARIASGSLESCS